MYELRRHEFTQVLPLLSGIRQRVLPYAICEGINPGRVFVDWYEQPRIALLWSPVGYYFLAGDPDKVEDLSEISRVVTEIFIPTSQIAGETGFILLTSTESWKAYLPDLLPGREVIEIYRRFFNFDIRLFAKQGNWRERIPEDLRLLPIDAELAEQVGALNSWASGADFQEDGLGFALQRGDQIISTCMSVFASRDWVEIDVHTIEEYRRRGFAMLTASAFMEACLQQGKRPNWECFWDNEPSIALAGKLGFRAMQDYPVYYWEESTDKAYP